MDLERTPLKRRVLGHCGGWGEGAFQTEAACAQRPGGVGQQGSARLGTAGAWLWDEGLAGDEVGRSGVPPTLGQRNPPVTPA